MTLYSYREAEKLMEHYIEKNGNVHILDEGCLVYGLVICEGEGLKTTVIQEVYLNEWSSAQKIRMYSKMPKKYAKMIESLEMED